MTTHDRLSNNNTTYLDSTAPRYVPGGGGWSVSQFTLRSLFNQHLRLRNWWTQSNDTLPLIRYTGCKFILYRNSSVDYMVTYNNNLHTKASRLLYSSTQPAVMNLLKHRKILTCKQYNKKTRNYKKLKIKPPPQMRNTWHFQYDIADFPLVTIMSTACSLDRWYLSSTAISSSISLTTLNCQSFQKHNFKAYGSLGYQPQENQYFYGLETYKDITTITPADIIYLANTNNFTLGTKIKDAGSTSDTPTQAVEKYMKDPLKWGNPFASPYLTGNRYILVSNQDPKTLLANTEWTTKLAPGTGDKIAYKSTPNLHNCRYNPYKDTGTNNRVYLLKLNNPNETWGPPDKPELIGQNLPLWCLLWGYLDWQRKAGIETDIDANNLIVVQSDFIDPHETYYCFLDNDFLQDTSPYRPRGEKTLSDYKFWHPKVCTQIQSINEICSSGPGTVKLQKERSCEASCSYTFYFKLGGDPPPMELVSDPEKQPKWPVPNNLCTIPSLQSPTTPITNYLYKFDQRGDYITQRAIKRLKKDPETKGTVLPLAGTTLLDLPPESQASSQTETSDSEKEEPTLQLQLRHQRKQQQLLNKRIRKLLEKLSKLE